MVPHIFSGVVARMLNGFPCITAEHMVEELLEEWREERRREELGDLGRDVVFVVPVSEVDAGTLVTIDDQDEELDIEELENIMGSEGISSDEDLVEVVEVEEIVVTQWRRRVEELTVIHRLANLTIDDEEDLLEALALRDKECSMVLSTTINHLEVAFLICNLAATLLLFLVSNMAEYPRLHLPWMLFSSIEIVGNFVVAIAFLLIPGRGSLFFLKEFRMCTLWRRSCSPRELCLRCQALLAEVLSKEKKKYFESFFALFAHEMFSTSVVWEVLTS